LQGGNGTANNDALFQLAPLPPSTPLLETTLPGFATFRRGKVRELFEVGNDLLLVASDRISAFDHVMESGIPDKGRILTQLSAFWFARTSHITANHLLTSDTVHFPTELAPHASLLAGRAMLVTRTTPIPIECVARGYLSGSGWKDYQATGHVCGIALPPGLHESDPLPETIFTPATKALSGHDINISEGEAAAHIGSDLLQRLKQLTLALYSFGASHAARCGIILADTKFEFGQTALGELLLIDEVMTPDSSRYWPSDAYQPGGPQPSFDKQFLRDYLETVHWNKQPPVPSLPKDVVHRTREKYLDAYRRLTDAELPDWP
jgi:phosphoribosylaminoimidazole-succinocarboxamide synthase